MRGLICDDHPLMREALAQTMQDRWPGLVLGEAGNYPSAWRHAEARPDFCIVDLDMPGATPLEGLAGLRARAPKMVLMVLTGLTDDALLEAVLAFGVAGLFSKNTEAEVLIAAIGRAVPALRDLEVGRLPPRQQEVLQLLSEGLTNKEIARQMGISPGTVKIHVSRVQAWLGAANRTDAVARAQRARMV